MICNVCKGTGFKNTHQLPERILGLETDGILKWISENDGYDVCVCDCCGDGEVWYGEPGQHYRTRDDQPGRNGPYAYNGGNAECS
jgi:hypothetical protein